MPGTLIIGCGNPLRGDDGLAWHAIAHLSRRARLRRTPMICCHQLVPELADYIKGATRVIFIDARVAPGREHPPGTVSVEKLEARPADASPIAHHLDPSGLLSFADRVYGSRPEAFISSVVGDSFDVSDKLSAPVQEGMMELVRRVAALVRSEPGAGHKSGSRVTPPGGTTKTKSERPVESIN